MSYDLFISYNHNDDAEGRVRELCEAIAAGFRDIGGRDISIFFDGQDIPSMADWEDRIIQGLRESSLLLAVISPGYLASAFCRLEWDLYTRYEAMRHCLGDGIAPVYLVSLRNLEANLPEIEADGWLERIRARQWFDLREWHTAGSRVLEDPQTAARFDELRAEIVERLSRADRSRRSPTNVYRHNPQFVGRVRELAELRSALRQLGQVGVLGDSARHSVDHSAVTVHGLGGLGKTELALAYAHAFAWDYPGGRWLLRCDGLETFDLALQQLAGPLEVRFTEDERRDARIAAERILAELRRRDRCLLLLDNVTEAALLGPHSLMRLPPPERIHVLATTRMGPDQIGGSPDQHHFIAVDELPDEDALALISAHQPGARFLNSAEKAAANRLVKLLAGFTLAVETAAVYLGRNSSPQGIADYTRRLGRELLAESEASAADPKVAVRHEEKLLEGTLSITLETLSKEQLRVLSVAALLPADQVALPWIRESAGRTFPTLAPDAGAQSDIEWSVLADSIFSLRLLKPGEDARVARMHRLVQEILKRDLGEHRPGLEDPLIVHVCERARLQKTSWAIPERRWELSPLAACAVSWIDRPGGEGAWLANEVSIPLKELGRLSEAEHLGRDAVKAARAAFGDNDPRYASCLDNLGQVLAAMDRFADAESTIREALSISERNLGPTNRSVGVRLHNLGLVLEKLGRSGEAEAMMRRALDIEEGIHGRHHPSTTRLLHSLGLLLMDANRTTEAEPLLRRALDIDERSLGPSHPAVASSLNNLASLLQLTGRRREAEPLRRRALVIWEKAYGEEHPEVAAGLLNLAHLLREEHRLNEAEPLARRALSVVERTTGENTSGVSAALVNLGQLLQAMDRPDEAEPILRRALSIDEAIFPPNHPTLAIDCSNLGGLLLEVGRLEESEPFLYRALAITEEAYHRNHPAVADALTNLASLLQAASRLGEAEIMTRKAVSIWEKMSGDSRPQLADALNRLAHILEGMGRPEPAEPILLRVARIFFELSMDGSGEHPLLATALANYRDLLSRLGCSREIILAKMRRVGDSYRPQDRT